MSLFFYLTVALYFTTYLFKKYGEFAEILENEFKMEATGVVDLQVQIMELFVFH